MRLRKKSDKHDGPVRVRPASMGGPAVVRHPVSGDMWVPDPSRVYSADHPVVKAHPWLFVDSEQEFDAQKASPSVPIPNVSDPAEMVKAHAQADLDLRAQAAELADDPTAQPAVTFTVEQGEDGPYIRFAETWSDPYRDQGLYTRPDGEWLALFGLARAAALVTGSRADRAEALATRGQLNAEELAHLRYLAEAADPIDSVKPGTEPLTGAQAKDILALVTGR